jgi:hypothetical protein
MRKAITGFSAALALVVLAVAPAFAECASHTASTETASKESLSASAGQTATLPQTQKPKSDK